MENYEEDIYSRRVGFGYRFGALVIDVVILMVLGYVFKMILGIKDPTPEELMEGMEPGNIDMGAMMLTSMKASLISYVVGLLYTSTEIFLRKTPGKMALGLIVTDENGNTPATNAMIIRYLFKQASTIFIVLAVLLNIGSLIWIGSLLGVVFLIGCFFTFGEKRMGFHDMLAKTAVYKEKELAELQQHS